jgi:hypothetical protein
MKTSKPILTGSVLAAANLTQCRLVGFDGNVCAANAKPMGAVEADTDSGQMAPVTEYGEALVESGGAITVGAKLASDASGRVAVWSTGEIAGWALDAASGAGEKIRVKLL